MLVCCAFNFVACVAAWMCVVESPRWYLARAMHLEAVDALTTLRGAWTERDTMSVAAIIGQESAKTSPAGAFAGFHWWHLITHADFLRAMISFCTLIGIQQLSGLSLAVRRRRDSLAGVPSSPETRIAYVITMMFGIIVCSRMVDLVGRRACMLTSLAGMFVANVSMACVTAGCVLGSPGERRQRHRHFVRFLQRSRYRGDTDAHRCRNISTARARHRVGPGVRPLLGLRLRRILGATTWRSTSSPYPPSTSSTPPSAPSAPLSSTPPSPRRRPNPSKRSSRCSPPRASASAPKPPRPRPEKIHQIHQTRRLRVTPALLYHTSTHHAHFLSSEIPPPPTIHTFRPVPSRPVPSPAGRLDWNHIMGALVSIIY